jgi:hypothetical protein
LHGMGDERGLWKQHREDVAREIRARRRPVRPAEAVSKAGRLVTFWRELGLDAARLAGVFGRSPVPARKRKGVT